MFVCMCLRSFDYYIYFANIFNCLKIFLIILLKKLNVLDLFWTTIGFDIEYFTINNIVVYGYWVTCFIRCCLYNKLNVICIILHNSRYEKKKLTKNRCQGFLDWSVTKWTVCVLNFGTSRTKMNSEMLQVHLWCEKILRIYIWIIKPKNDEFNTFIFS